MRRFATNLPCARPVVMLAAVVLFVASPARAGLVAVNFSGTIHHVDRSIAGLAGIAAGSQYTGTFVYDNASVDTLPGDPTLGQYLYGNNTVPPLAAPIGISLSIAGGPTITPDYSGAVIAGVLNDGTIPALGLADSFEMSQRSKVDGTPLAIFNRLFVGFFDTTRTRFSSDALPTTLSTAGFNLGLVQIIDMSGGGNGRSLLEASIDGLGYPLATVPEPSSFVLAGLGLAGVVAAGIARRRHRAA